MEFSFNTLSLRFPRQLRPTFANRRLPNSWHRCGSIGSFSSQPSLRRERRIPLNILRRDSHWECREHLSLPDSPSLIFFLFLLFHTLEPLFRDGRFIVLRYGSLSAQLWQQYRTKGGASTGDRFCTQIDRQLRWRFLLRCVGRMPINRFRSTWFDFYVLLLQGHIMRKIC